MLIQDFNAAASASAPPHPPTESTPVGSETDTSIAGESLREDALTALLKARIEHLELVVETARSLMSTNQERLLRRLHDLPQEMIALTAALNRLDQAVAPRGAPADGTNVRPLQARRAV